MKHRAQIELTSAEIEKTKCISYVYKGINNSLTDPEFQAQHRLNEKAFTRKRDLPFERLVSFLMKPRSRSTQTELQGLFAAIEGEAVPTAMPTAAAVSKARRSLSESVFQALNQQAIEQFLSGFGRPIWNGFRLFAVDGTTFQLPAGKDLEASFGHQESGPTLARGSTLYDLDLRLVVDFRVAAYCVCERELAIDHLTAAGPGDLLLYDRGYPAFWLFALHLMKGIDCVMRLPRHWHPASDAFWEGNASSTLITLTPSKQQARACLDQGVEPTPITLRLVRVTLNGGETEILATTVLEEERLPAHLFKALYHRRWGTEEGYKHDKQRAEIENLSGRSPLAVRQDMHAKVLAMNLAAMLRAVAQQISERLYAARRGTYQVRPSTALANLSDQLFRLLLLGAVESLALLQRLVQSLSQAVEAVRPDRTFPRRNPKRRKAGFHMPYKRVV